MTLAEQMQADEGRVRSATIPCPTCHGAEDGCARCDGNGAIVAECQCVLWPVIAADCEIHDKEIGR